MDFHLLLYLLVILDYKLQCMSAQWRSVKYSSTDDYNYFKYPQKL